MRLYRLAYYIDGIEAEMDAEKKAARKAKQTQGGRHG